MLGCVFFVVALFFSPQAICVCVRGNTLQLCVEQYKANPESYILQLLAFKKKKKEDTMGFIHYLAYGEELEIHK